MGVYQNRQLALAGPPGKDRTLGLPWGKTFPAWFQSIPPERVGLNGEYDYYGLQKRVEALFRQQFSASDLAHLKVKQRGRVVVLQGHVASQDILKRLVDLASEVEGAIRVETVWLTFGAEAEPWISV